MDEAERFNTIAMMNNGRLLMNESPAAIKSSMKQMILEIVTPLLRDTYKLIVDNTDFETQLFGDRIDIAVNNENDYGSIEMMLNKNNIQLTDHRMKPVSLENVFIHVLKKADPTPTLPEKPDLKPEGKGVH
jgi:ABC-type multidrug transport system ATPase subunit